MNAQQSKCLRSFRQGLRRFAWRLQYSSKVRHSKESLSLDERHYGYNFTSDVITTIYIKELLLMIPSEKARYIVKRLYLDGYTEKEVATELQLSQQAVSKWFRLKGKPCPSLKGGVIRVLSCQPPRAYANPNRWRRSGE